MIIEQELPNTEGINKALRRVDFYDSFATTNQVNTLNDIVLMVFGSAPNWVSWLFRFRNFIVRFIGLKTDFEQTKVDFVVGGHIGFFEIFSICHNEVVIGADDSHLNFRASIYNSDSSEFNIHVTTLVQFHNKLGRAYMFVIKPFHRIVVKAMVKQAFKIKEI